MKILKIGISGAHSTGKSTFVKKLEQSLFDRSISFKSVSDLAVKCPLPILHDHTVESTLWIASRGVADEIEAGSNCQVVIVDRPIIDCWAYFNAVCEGRYQETNHKLLTLRSLISSWLPTYDIIYQTVIDRNIPIEDKKGRHLDEGYTELIGNQMISAAKLFHLQPKLLTFSNKDVELADLLQQVEGTRLNK